MWTRKHLNSNFHINIFHCVGPGCRASKCLHKLFPCSFLAASLLFKHNTNHKTLKNFICFEVKNIVFVDWFIEKAENKVEVILETVCFCVHVLISHSPICQGKAFHIQKQHFQCVWETSCTYLVIAGKHKMPRESLADQSTSIGRQHCVPLGEASIIHSAVACLPPHGLFSPTSNLVICHNQNIRSLH